MSNCRPLPYGVNSLRVRGVRRTNPIKVADIDRFFARDSLWNLQRIEQQVEKRVELPIWLLVELLVERPVEL